MDNLFWLGRYAERTEAFVRILRAVTARLSDDPAAALEVARKLLIPFSHASDNPIEEIAERTGAGRRAAASDLSAPAIRRGLQRLLARVEQTGLVGARPAVARHLAHHPCPGRQRTSCRTQDAPFDARRRALLSGRAGARAPRPCRAFRRRT